ncbi:uncharacterized protein clcf1 [Austrofundulus limnaeus]|uniref:Uncharacterized protein clcf1 n=1 Tax=Austrofundulus limnaeus TaxID=52670 RepID=A0A2I4B3F5_AUSLI|nr:PREDICTED: cardiotrophin-like cytokine factor 1 [Austrofundulus limnaeus]
MRSFCRANHLLSLLLAVAGSVALVPSHNLASERSSIESTYELTKYLEYQLKEIKDVYLTYLGPPFNEKDFSPPRPNSTALILPSAATRLDLWHGLENQARLAQNQRAYSILLAAVRELARSTLCPSLKISLLHFCTGLDGLLGSISTLMTSLGYSPLPQSANARGKRTEGGQHSGQQRSGTKGVRGERDGGTGMVVTDKNRRDGRRAAASGGRSGGPKDKAKRGRVRREKREEPHNGIRAAVMKEEHQTEVGRRRLLSIDEDWIKDDRQAEFRVEVSYLSSGGTINQEQSDNEYSFDLTSLREDGFIVGRSQGSMIREEKLTDMDSSSSMLDIRRRSPRSLLSPTLQPPLSTLSLLYQFGAGEEHTLLPQTVPLSLQRGTSLLSPPLNPLFSSSSASSSSLLSVRPKMNDFARKVEGFWILRELQSWLWRSAKDFNRLKKRLRD